MPDIYLHTNEIQPIQAHSKRRLIGQKPPLKPKEVWSIRVRLQINEKTRDLALFNLSIDSKLRSCDLVALRISDVVMAGSIRERAVIVQQKTGRPVQFELTEQTREAVYAWIAQLRILVIPITRTGFIRSSDLPNAMSGWYHCE